MDANIPRLVPLHPDGRSGRAIEISADYMTLGRSDSNDFVLSDPTVSRTHAALSRNGQNDVYLQDLGSTAGTRVNGRPLTQTSQLHTGDVVAFGGARFTFIGCRGDPGATVSLPVQREGRLENRPAGRQGRNYRIESQHGANISNVAGDQYTSYVRHERESFLREIAATRTKARWLIWSGACIALVGLVLFGKSLIEFANFIFGSLKQAPTPGSIPVLPDNIMTPVVFVGYALWGLGLILMGIGLVLHIVATARRRRADRELPAPPRRPY